MCRPSQGTWASGLSCRRGRGPRVRRARVRRVRTWPSHLRLRSPKDERTLQPRAPMRPADQRANQSLRRPGRASGVNATPWRVTRNTQVGWIAAMCSGGPRHKVADAGSASIESTGGFRRQCDHVLRAAAQPASNLDQADNNLSKRVAGRPKIGCFGLVADCFDGFAQRLEQSVGASWLQGERSDSIVASLSGDSTRSSSEARLDQTGSQHVANAMSGFRTHLAMSAIPARIHPTTTMCRRGARPPIIRPQGRA